MITAVGVKQREIEHLGRTTREYDFILAETLAAPDQVWRSRRFGNARLFSRWYTDVQRGKQLVVVVVSEPDATNRHWIITPYLTRKLVEGEVEWRRN